MRSIGGIAAVALLFLACPRLAAADEVEIKSSYFKYGGIKYFRGKAEDVRIGSFGEKKTPLGKMHYLEVEDTIARKTLATHGQVTKSRPVTINWEKYSKTDVSAHFAFKYFTMDAKTAVTGDYEKFKSAKLKLVKLVIQAGPMKTIINNSDDARDYLRKEGSDGRIVTEVWIVADAKLATHLDKSTHVTLSGSGNAGGDLELTADLSAGSTTSESHTIIIPKGTTFAYLLAKVKDWNKDKTLVEDLEDDSRGLN